MANFFDVLNGRNVKRTHAASGYDDDDDDYGQAAASYAMKRGETIVLGHYPGDSSYAETPLSWLVIHADGASALAVSTWGIAWRPMHDRDGEITWDKCALRYWLNTVFYKECFSDDEREIILEKTLGNERNSVYGGKRCPATRDHVFCLSYNMVSSWFGGYLSRNCLPAPWLPQGASGESCSWWLRTHGGAPGNMARINSQGVPDLYGYAATDDTVLVRPAMWVRRRG